ncbi:MAG: nitroreductase family protein [Verrucomicrobiota bacterium]
MQTFEAIAERRAVKHYDPEHRLTPAEKERLLQAALLSPTSFNIQNWRLVVVEDPELRQEVRAAAWDQAQVTEASLLIVLCADLKSWAREPSRYWVNAPEPVQEMLVPMIGQFYEGREWIQRDEAMRSTGIIGQTIMLAAKDMGYDSCPMVGFDPEKVAELIRLPEDHVVSFIVVVGKATKPAYSRGGQLPMSEVVVTDRF